MMGLWVVEYVGTVATSGGGERGCATVVEPEEMLDVEIVIGEVSEPDEELLVRVDVGWFRNRWDEIGTK